jgi:two-component system, OmpR family, sensor histidine kinase QseC
MKPGWSLRRRLLAALVSLAAALFAVSATQNYLAYRAASSRLFDDSLRETAGLLMKLVQHEVAEHGRLLGIELLRAETTPGPYDFRFQVWTPDMQSGYPASGGQAPLVPFDTAGFATTDVDGESWRAYSMWNPARTLQVQIAQRQELRIAQQRHSLLRTAVSFGVLMMIGTLMIWWIVGETIRPLRDTAVSVGRRSEEDLRPVDASTAPREVMPLLQALNRLLERISAVLSAERRFTSDAAHELRTPLAAIRANAQVLVGARDSDERDRTARDLLASVDRSTRLIDQLLALARVDQTRRFAHFEELDLADIAGEQLRQHLAMAQRLGVRLDSQLGSAVMRGDPGLLAAMARNLVDNALRYTPSGGSVRIRTDTTARGPELMVSDDGPGIAPADRLKVFERFHRLAGAGSQGSGLGLSIVRRIVEQHGGSIVIEDGNDGRGTTIRITFAAGGSGSSDDRIDEIAEGGPTTAPRLEPDLRGQI